MAECLIRNIDKVNADALLDAKCTKLGDFIVIQDDGWPWGGEELAENGPYDILVIPAVWWKDIEYLTRPENLPPASVYRRKRGFNLDVTKLPPRASGNWAANKVTMPWNLQAFQANIITKIPLNDPNII